MTERRALAGLGVAAGELPGHGGGRGDLDGRVEAEADEGGRRRHGAGADRDDRLDDVVGDRRGHQQADPPGEDGAAVGVAAGTLRDGARAALLVALRPRGQGQRVPRLVPRAHGCATSSRHSWEGDTARTTPSHLPQGRREVGVGDLVAGLTSLERRDHEAAAPQARQVVRDVGPREPERPGELCRIARTVEQRDQQPAPGGVGQRTPDPREGGVLGLTGQHALNRTATTEQWGRVSAVSATAPRRRRSRRAWC